MNVSQKSLASSSLASHNPTNNSDPSRLPLSSSSGMASASAGVAPSTAGRGTSTASATTGNTLDPASPDPVPVTALVSATATTSSSSLFSSPDLEPLVAFLQTDRDALQQELKEKDDEIKDLKQKIKEWEEKAAFVRAILLE